MNFTLDVGTAYMPSVPINSHITLLCTGTNLMWNAPYYIIPDQQLLQFVAEGEQRHLNQLEVLLGERQPDNRNRQQQTANNMRQRDFPAKQDEPNDIKNRCETALTTRCRDDGFAEWR